MRIGQLVQAEVGWRAVFAEPDGSESLSRVLAWAALADDAADPDDALVGLIVDPDDASRVVATPEAASPAGGAFSRYRFVAPEPIVVVAPARSLRAARGAGADGGAACERPPPAQALTRNPRRRAAALPIPRPRATKCSLDPLPTLPFPDVRLSREIEARTGSHPPAEQLSRKKSDMTRYRLTYDPNPKELARREAGGSHVVLLWSRRRRRAAVVVEEDATGELVELDVRERENPLELYEHPYAYIERRGHPGRRFGAAGPAAA